MLAKLHVADQPQRTHLKTNGLLVFLYEVVSSKCFSTIWVTLLWMANRVPQPGHLTIFTQTELYVQDPCQRSQRAHIGRRVSLHELVFSNVDSNCPVFVDGNGEACSM